MKGFFLGFLLGLLAFPTLLAVIGHLLRVEDPLVEADVIIAISGDRGPRAETAAALWHEGYAPLLIFAGSSEDPTAPASAEIMKRHAVSRGVPEDRIILEPESATTAENARQVARLMSAQGLRSAILVTSPYHQRRASIHFARAFAGTELHFINHPARDASWDPTLWWLGKRARALTLVELAKLGLELVETARGRVSLRAAWP
ncbi:MAG: YdcF family protein [Candidatus Limnocylindria bacterium]